MKELNAKRHISRFLELLLLRTMAQTVPQACASSGEHKNLTVHEHRIVVYKPQAASKNLEEKTPGIVVLHGSYGSPESMFGVGFEDLADKHGFLVIYPSTKVPEAVEWGYKDDIPFFVELSKRLSDGDVGLDENRLFVCGHSAGGTMALFLQNELDVFQAAGAVEAAVGKLAAWNMSRDGHRTMVVWNHADPVLEHFAPPGGEPAYYNLTIDTLRRNGSKEPTSSRPLPLSENVTQAQVLYFPQDDSTPELVMLSWRSNPDTHDWASMSWTRSFDAAEELARFFLSIDIDMVV